MSARKLLLNKRGQSIVEITLIAPLLLAALYVATDFGILFFTAQYTQSAAREGARIGSILTDCAIDSTVPCAESVSNQACPGTAAIVKEVCNHLPNMLTDKKVTVTLTGTYFPAICMREVKVTASGTYPYGLYRVMGMLGFSVPTTTLVTRSANARYQGQPVTVTGSC